MSHRIEQMQISCLRLRVRVNNAAMLFLLTAAVALVSCASHPPLRNVGRDEAREGSVSLNESDHVMAVLWFQYAAEARALYYQAYNLAKDRLDAAISEPHPADSLAIIVDIDETILDNSPFQAYLIRKGRRFSPALWSKWTGARLNQALPGAQPFLAYAASNGVAVFYVSNRSAEEFEATARNLAALKFPMADSSHLFLQEDKAGKEPHRREIQKKYKVVLLIGDNLGDFLADFDKRDYADRFQLTDVNQAEFGRRFIILPNPMYGEWESSLYPSRDLPEDVKTELRRSLLKSWQPSSSR